MNTGDPSSRRSQALEVAGWTFGTSANDDVERLLTADGGRILSAGDSPSEDSDSLWLVVRGCLGRGLFTGDDRVQLPQALFPGRVLGEDVMATGLPPLPVKTETRVVAALVPSFLWRVDLDVYKGLLDDNMFLRNLIQRLADEVISTRRYLDYHAVVEKDVVLARCLCLLANALGRPVMESLEIEIRQEDLARFACLTRRHVNACLGKWAEEGIIETAKGRLLVVEIPRLLELARIRDLNRLEGDPEGKTRLE